MLYFMNSKVSDFSLSYLSVRSLTSGLKRENAVNYAQNHKESLMIYLKNGEYEIANNSAEWRAKV